MPRSLQSSALQTVREVAVDGAVPLYVHPGWARAFPWLVQGTTARGGPVPFDLRLFGPAPGGEVLARWDALRTATRCARAVHGRQVHGTRVLLHDAGPPGLFLAPACDGHATRATGVLLAVSLADCVPVSLVDAERGAVALVHAGWRGIAAGVLERAMAVLADRLASSPADLHVHLGPGICGSCYEVGPEVHRALELPEPDGPTPVDLRAVLLGRAEAAGVPAERITVSEHCTRCPGSPFFSHRGGDEGRHAGVLGILAERGAV